MGENLAFTPDASELNMKSFTDGTSRTIRLVEADPEHAVVWTRPEDLLVDLENPKRGITDGEAIFLTGLPTHRCTVSKARSGRKLCETFSLAMAVSHLPSSNLLSAPIAGNRRGRSSPASRRRAADARAENAANDLRGDARIQHLADTGEDSAHFAHPRLLLAGVRRPIAESFAEPLPWRGIRDWLGAAGTGFEHFIGTLAIDRFFIMAKQR